jgi:hypothetical protein
VLWRSGTTQLVSRLLKLGVTIRLRPCAQCAFSELEMIQGIWFPVFVFLMVTLSLNKERLCCLLVSFLKKDEAYDFIYVSC